ncbi:citrate synthase [Aspergillus coremiiformis]|uniref:Citrate synthase n=1 Tax=Aspergillus coremiiformis TaxID=138285 RepID=A0A5N6ZDN3_9EURO|nr:citrate synthase [Aspergillus coremiiformis]
MSSGTLHIVDSRTNWKYEIPIKRNAVSAVDFTGIKAPGAGTDRADHVAGGLRVHDPGLQNTTVMESAISFSDHERGLLLFRGYTLAQLWDSDVEDMLHLLVWGTYPTAQQKKELSRDITEQMLAVPQSVQKTIQALPSTTSPLPLILAGLSAYLASCPETIPASTHAHLYQGNPQNVDVAVTRSIAAYAVIFGLVNSHRRGIEFHPPSFGKTYCENLFTMAGLIDRVTGRPDPVKLSCFRRFAMLNADHGMALTVFSTIVTASSLTDPISCLISAVAAAYGPLHFGATESAQRALRDIGTPDRVPKFIEEVKKGRQKLFGYGHRSYKGPDPRVHPIQSILKDLDLSSNNLLKITERIEQVASADEYFRQRRLYPNADFYGNFVFTGIGFDPDTIPAAMLAQRIIGIMAHWREYMLTRGKLFRPSHIYIETTPLLLPQSTEEEQYSIFTTNQKRLIILTAAIASTFSPLSANIYYPALNSIATDLDVTNSQINLTITTYMICQGLAPTLTGSFADQAGRRPAYLLCFLIYITSNIALALQHSFPALLVLRAIQSSGSSGTVALASAVAADVITSAERGTYMSITSLGNILGPSLGPILGGILSQYLGWQSIFCWRSGTSNTAQTVNNPATHEPTPPEQPPIRKINPLATLLLLIHLPTGLILLSNGLIFASYYAVTAGLPSQLKSTYGLSDLDIGLSFISMGLGSLLSATFNGLIVDWNYRRTLAKSGLNISKNSQDIDDFEVEKARLGIGGPMTLLTPIPILLYAFVSSSDRPPPLVLTLALIFTISFTLTATYNILNILLVDLHYSTPATVMATNNLVRCFLGAAATALVHPCIRRWGVQITYSGVAVVVLSVVPLLGMVWVMISDIDLMTEPETANLPIISTHGLDSKSTYLLLFVDLDVRYKLNATVALHWYQPDLVPIFENNSSVERSRHNSGLGEIGNCARDGILRNQSMGAEYIAPRPPPYSHHRYVYFLFNQGPEYQFPNCYSHIFPPTAEARGGFNIHQFVDVAQLDAPVAGNYFFVEYDGPVIEPTATASPTTTWLRLAPCESVIATGSGACERPGYGQVVM